MYYQSDTRVRIVIAHEVNVHAQLLPERSIYIHVLLTNWIHLALFNDCYVLLLFVYTLLVSLWCGAFPSPPPCFYIQYMPAYQASTMLQSY